jgi:hypothetical protein
MELFTLPHPTLYQFMSKGVIFFMSLMDAIMANALGGGSGGGLPVLTLPTEYIEITETVQFGEAENAILNDAHEKGLPLVVNFSSDGFFLLSTIFSLVAIDGVPSYTGVYTIDEGLALNYTFARGDSGWSCTLTA